MDPGQVVQNQSGLDAPFQGIYFKMFFIHERNSPTPQILRTTYDITIRPMMLFQRLFLAATALCFSRAASHDRLLKLESCNGKIVTLYFNFFIELQVSEGCKSDDRKAIGGYIKEEINALIGYIPGNEKIVEAILCPIPESVPSEARLFQKAGTYSYSGGGTCSRCTTNKRISGTTVSTGGKRNLKGTGKSTTISQTEARTVGMKENQLELEMKKLNDTVNQSNGEISKEANKSLENEEQTSKADVKPIQNNEELDKPTIEMQTFGAELVVNEMNGEEFKDDMAIEMGNLVAIAGILVKMLPGDLINKYGLENNGCLDKEPAVTVRIVLPKKKASKLTNDDCSNH